MPESRTIIAVTGEDEDDRFAPIRSRAGALAAGTRATVILYDVDAASTFSSPVPTEWSGEGEQQFVGERFDPDELDAQGRSPIAQQVRGLRSVGVDAWGWLPQSAEPADLARYAASQRADLVLVPDDWADAMTGATDGATDGADRVATEAVPVTTA